MLEGLFFLALASALLAADADASNGLLEERHDLLRVDGSHIDVDIYRPASAEPMPAVLYVDGSLCLPSIVAGRWLLPDAGSQRPFALVIVEKPGVVMPEGSDGNISIGPDFQCSAEFRRYYDRNQRISDHLRALQFLRQNADWWDGDLRVWGFSDGAAFGAEIAAFIPETSRAVLGGFGGGLSFADEMQDYAICPPSMAAGRAECLSELQAQYDRMRANPTSDEDWLGSANTWRVWASRLDAVEANILVDVTFPLVVFHGAQDRSVPVESARLLASRLEAERPDSFEYWEIEEMGHNLSSATGPDASVIRGALLGWITAAGSASMPPSLSEVLAQAGRGDVHE